MILPKQLKCTVLTLATGLVYSFVEMDEIPSESSSFLPMCVQTFLLDGLDRSGALDISIVGSTALGKSVVYCINVAFFNHVGYYTCRLGC